ncbi:MAG: hypothetical protein UR27_C0004G0017 [Candidatus Peregrinibacteria bacterium GW2011_GWA2_33_10]|nr:MAG: hypothetical protein UR27_C0004G0017 [Candidatus Peregrinibacteria bacterium GW2011_GWA2_33_10]KKP41182.1 MAG: branched-chain amino acid aminotransferase, branched-chain amino acid aminotransferase [Candidatus Peregrinibacteria bacterium GW2011_GWC2_33_13]OGJ50578.1 MAG: branched-chain-amino-acid transaminase [Candidatus Peregrinibacteria bacterium RIFOXYA2_FULL_33_7]
MQLGKIWMNGIMMDQEDARVSVITHGLHYGSAVFEGIRFYETPDGSAIFRAVEHMERLFYSAKAIEMEMKINLEKWMEGCKKVVSENNLKSGYIRPIAFYADGKMGLNPRGAGENYVIAAWPWGSYLGEEAIKVKISEYIRLHPKSTIADAKISGHYVNSILASQEIHKLGYNEALFLDYEGNVAEGPGENIFITKDKKIYTPPKGNILAGITRDSVIKIAKDSGYEVIEKKISVQELFDADEAFFTGTAAEITQIASIDENIYKSHDITLKLKEKFKEIVGGQNKNYLTWLTYI